MKLSYVLALFAILVAAPFSAQAFENEKPPIVKTEAEVEAPSIKAIAFHSDSCGSCKILGPRMAEAMEVINPTKIEAVKFDFTNKDSIAETRVVATNANVDKVLQKYGAKTGFVVLVNGNGDVVDQIKVDHKTPEIAAKLATAIANAS